MGKSKLAHDSMWRQTTKIPYLSHECNTETKLHDIPQYDTR